MRDDRRHGQSRPGGNPLDPRRAGALDRDRILYSEPFRRLLGVTQVVGVHEGAVYHNRLTHSMKVGQIARRIAEKLLYEHQRAETVGAFDEWGGLDPEVAEGAALAHDIGHPPFGHAGEVALDELTRDRGCAEGFEGNAQSFRILTKIAFRKIDPDKPPGLDLSRATLRATLKYPWMRLLDDNDEPIDDQKRSWKWGAYETERADFEFALALDPPPGGERTLEAEIMDWADDVTYAVHDLEDFYRAGLIPLPSLVLDNEERERFLRNVCDRKPELEYEAAVEAFDSVRGLLPSTPFTGAAGQLGGLTALRSALITTLIGAFRLPTADGEEFVVPRVQRVAEVLKQLTWNYVITSPELASQEYGQRRVLTEIFDAFCSVDEDGNDKPEERLLRPPFLNRAIFDECHPARRAADYVASLSEAQALALHGRLTGHSPGSVRDLMV